MQSAYTNEQLFQIAQRNYKKMNMFCETLEKEGYWEKPMEILNEPIIAVLDKYIQAILMNLSAYCGYFKKEEKKFIMRLPSTNAIGCKDQDEQDEICMLTAKKIMASPPILLQLCGIRDEERDSMFTAFFFDALLNIILSLSYFNKHHSEIAVTFIQEYYKKNNVFINHTVIEESITPSYLTNKLNAYEFERQKVKRKKKVIKEKLVNIKEKENEQQSASLQKPMQEQKNSSLNTLSDEELQNMLREGKLKINAPKLKELQRKKKEALERELEEARVNEIKKKIEETKRNNELEKLLDELEMLIGLKEVKNEMGSLVNLIKIRKLRESYQMPSMDMSYHMVFTGNPGTGKTTVARLVAKIYKELGLLSNGQLVETDRSGLVAGYIGQTALKVKEVVEQAIGGVLFIDEAYALSSGDMSNDFGKEAIDTLVKMMEDNRDNLIVIVAGYNKEMEEFLKANTGLISRFNKFINFPDYSNQELMEILEDFSNKSGVNLEEDAKKVIEEGLSSMKEENKINFGNARGIRNTFEKIMINQANRIVTIAELTQEELSRIKIEDVQGVL